MTHDSYIKLMNTSGKSLDATQNPPPYFLSMFRMYGMAMFMTAYIRSLAHWMQVNGKWVRK